MRLPGHRREGTVAVETWAYAHTLRHGCAPGVIHRHALGRTGHAVAAHRHGPGPGGLGRGFRPCLRPCHPRRDRHPASTRAARPGRADIAGLRARLSRNFHLYGRNGPHLYALSALDIALWDITGKAANLPLCRLLGAVRRTLRAYASLLRYADPALVAASCERALSLGYSDIKLHEIEVPMIAAARQAIGTETRLMVDTNCPWTARRRTTWPRASDNMT